MRPHRFLATALSVAVLVASEVAALRLLLLLGHVDGFAVDWSDPVGWARTADTTDLLAATGRLVGLGLAAWLLAATLASLARRAVPAWREVQALDALSLPVVRRMLDRLLAVSFGASALLGPAATAAAASPAPDPVAPASDGRSEAGAALVVVGDDGGVTVLPEAGAVTAAPHAVVAGGFAAGFQAEPTRGASRVADETPVVRAPDPARPPTTTPSTPPVPEPEPNRSVPGEPRSPAASTTSTPATPSPAAPDPAAPHPAATPTEAPTPAAAAPSRTPGSEASAGHRPTRSGGGASTADATTVVRSPEDARYTIRPGDSLWLVAERQVAASHDTGAPPGEREVARYWVRLVEANRSTLRSGNPGLVYPGEIILLPASPG